MDAWLNDHHLLYFWTVVREGSVSAASRKLRLGQPTVSQQLFHRLAGRLQLTDDGAHAFRYADEIFATPGSSPIRA
jgi:LysR family transcriptional regulator, transcriptional activator of nhaA